MVSVAESVQKQLATEKHTEERKNKSEDNNVRAAAFWLTMAHLQ